MIFPPVSRPDYYPVNAADLDKNYSYANELEAYVHPNQPAGKPGPQYMKNISHDPRKGLSSFFGFGKRSAEAGAFRQAHMTPNGIPGVLNLAVVHPDGTPIPFAPFEWNGRQVMSDAKGIMKYIDRDYFQTAISMENERKKYVTQMMSLVIGQTAESVIALFGFDFYSALAGGENDYEGPPLQARIMFKSYLETAGFTNQIIQQKERVFRRYCMADAAPEVMVNYGDNDPEWSKAFNKLSMLIEYHPSAIIFDKGTLNPLDSAGVVHGDSGHSNAGPPDDDAKNLIAHGQGKKPYDRFPDPNRANKYNKEKYDAYEAAMAARVAPADADVAMAPAGP